MKKAAFLDIDETLHKGFSTANSVETLYHKSLIDQETFKEFDNLLHHDPRRYSDYIPWCEDIDRLTLKIFNGKDKITLKKYLKEYEKEILNNLFPFTIPLINLLKQHGFEIILITGSLDFIAEIFADIFEVAYTNIIACRLVEQNGNYIMEFVPDFYMDSKDKKLAIERLSNELDLSKSIVTGDSSSDLEMFPLTGQSFLLKGEQTLDTLIQKAKDLDAVIVDKDSSVEEILEQFKQNFPN